MIATDRPKVPTEAREVTGFRKVWPPVALALGTLAYLLAFYGSNGLHSMALPLMFTPDELMLGWVGGDWSRFGPADHLPILLAAGVILGFSFLAGWLLLHALGVEQRLDPLERVFLATAAGLNVWSLFALAVGLAGKLQHRWVFGLAAGVVAGLSAWFYRRTRDSTGSRIVTRAPQKQESRPGLQKLALALCIPFGVLTVWGATIPTLDFDAREYHLQVPKEWYLSGAVTFLPHNVYGNMPLGAEMHTILGMVLMPGVDSWWWGSLVGKTVIASMAPLTALGLYTLGRRYFSATAGAVAAFIFLSTPWIAHVSISGLIEGASALYVLAAAYAGLLIPWHSAETNVPRASEVPESGESKGAVGLAALCGFLAGAGVACKYPALLFLVAPLGLFVVVQSVRTRRVWKLVVFAFAVIAGCGLWFAKNEYLAGNPTYPLLYDWLGGESWTAEQNERWTKAHGTPHDADGRSYTWWYFKSSLWQVMVASDRLHPVLWPLAIAGLITGRWSRPLSALVTLLIWGAAVWWLLTHRIDRFLVPLLPAAAMLAGWGASWRANRPWEVVAGVLLVWSAVGCFLYSATPLVGDSRFLVSLRELKEDLPHPADFGMTRFHEVHHYLNRHVQPGFQALLVGEARVFDIDVPILYNTCFDDCNFERLMRGRSREERRAALRENRISHVFFFWHELDRYREPGNYGYSDYVTRELVRAEFGDGQLLRRIPLNVPPDNGELYEVVGWREWE